VFSPINPRCGCRFRIPLCSKVEDNVGAQVPPLVPHMHSDPASQLTARNFAELKVDLTAATA
jgi:hypothetical protein